MEHGLMSGGEPCRELRTLVVEDRSLVAERLKLQLEALGHRVVGLAKDGRAAVRALSLDPELVITDNRLPVMDGIETARTLLAQRPVPIIVLTAYASADFVRRAREVGVMAYQVIPLDPRQLGRVIDEALVRFRELEIIRQEASDLTEALETRNLVERAKRVFMTRLRLSESESFQRLQQQSRRIGKSLGESASVIVRAEELLFKRGNIARNLQSVLAAIRRGLRCPPSEHPLRATAGSRPAGLEHGGGLAERSPARRPWSGTPLPFSSRGGTDARPSRKST